MAENSFPVNILFKIHTLGFLDSKIVISCEASFTDIDEEFNA